MKTCVRCGETKADEQFRYRLCRTCRNRQSSRWNAQRRQHDVPYRQAVNARSRKYRLATNRAKRATASSHRERYTAADVALMLRPDLTAVQIADMLGRTPLAIVTQRLIQARRLQLTTTVRAHAAKQPLYVNPEPPTT